MSKQLPHCRHWHRLAGFLLCIAATGCHQPTDHDLIGNWEVNYEDSKLKLTLNPDRTFAQVVEPKGKDVVRRNGRWELADLEGPCVVLNGALVLRDEKGNGTVEPVGGNGAWIMHIESGITGTRLPVNEDLGLYFDKVGK
jgi:hypothetical protein